MYIDHMSERRALFRPQMTVADLWPHLREVVAPDVLPGEVWDELEPLLPAIPGPVVGFERGLMGPELTEVGYPLPRWRRSEALEVAGRHPASAHLSPLVRAWCEAPGLDELCDAQFHTWDVGPDGVGSPCVFLMTRGRQWRAMVRAYADHLRARPDVPIGPASAHAVADALFQAEATTRVEGIWAVGVYLGRPGCPVRLSASVADRPWPDHPAWAQVDEVLAVAQTDPQLATVAFGPGPDPGEVWHVPVRFYRSPRPGEAARPLLEELSSRGLAAHAQAQALAGVDVTRMLPLSSATLDGIPAVTALWWSLERIKVVVGPEGWRSAKADMLARVIWRTLEGRALIDDR